MFIKKIKYVYQQFEELYILQMRQKNDLFKLILVLNNVRGKVMRRMKT